MANGYCPYVLSHLKTIAGCNAPSSKITPAGFLRSLLENRPNVEIINPDSALRLDDGAGHIRDLLNITCSTTVRLVCTGNRADIAVSPEEFAMMICDSLPTGAKATKLKYVKISPNNILYDAQTVFANEFKGLGFNIGPERFLFSIQYTIEGGYIKGCLNTCDC